MHLSRMETKKKPESRKERNRLLIEERAGHKYRKREGNLNPIIVA